MSDTQTVDTETETKPVKEKKARKPKAEKAAPVALIPVPAQPTPLADRQITQKKLEKLNEALKACMDDFEVFRQSTAQKGIAILAGKGALPSEVPAEYQAVSMPVDVIKGRRVGGTLFSTRLKNLLIQHYSPMQAGSWLLFDK